jgi:hypothetical protein
MVIGRGRRREHPMDTSEGVTTGVAQLPLHCFFRIEKNHPEIVFLLETIASRDQIYHLTLENADTLGVLHNLYRHYMKIKGADNQG